MKTYTDLFDRIISPENLFEAWESFKGDKRNKADVMEFERNLEKNIFQLHRSLKNGTYRHGRYYGFYIRDPKQRHIHKANVRDRVLHHAIFSIINPIFEKTFISTSFSCRIGFGTHKGVDVLERKAHTVARNGTSDCFVLKCDVRKFFDSVNHEILIAIFENRIKDEKTIWLLGSIIESYDSAPVGERESSMRIAKGNTNWQPYFAVFRERLYERVGSIHQA
jgi:retron-type reverse transcriptase